MCRVSHTHRGSDQSDQGWSFDTGCQHWNCHHASVRLSSPANRGPPLKHISHLMSGGGGGGGGLNLCIFFHFVFCCASVEHLTTYNWKKISVCKNCWIDQTWHYTGEERPIVDVLLSMQTCFAAWTWCTTVSIDRIVLVPWGKGRVQRCSHLKTCSVLKVKREKPKRLKLGHFHLECPYGKKFLFQSSQ